MPPSLDILKSRLIKRGSESEKSLNVRLNNAEKEISRKDEFDKIIVNNDFKWHVQKPEKLLQNLLINSMKVGLFFGSFNPYHSRS